MARIIVVEDDKSMNEILVETLGDDSHEVSTAFSGPEAIEICKSQTFDLLITDVRLPGIDGVETIDRIKRLQPKMKCIIITGYASEDTPVRAIRLNVNDYLFKPFSLAYFLNSVTRVLHQEEEALTKRNLFTELFSRFGLAIGDDDDVLLEGLVEDRQEAFRGLYVGIRSVYLDEESARGVYTGLENLESEFRKQMNASSPESIVTKRIQSEYRDVMEHLALLKAGATEERGTVSQDMNIATFRPLFIAVKNGDVSFGDLLYAPLLRKTPDTRFEAQTELLELKRRLWPQL
jgi:CheY-like chemotaxis protein